MARNQNVVVAEKPKKDKLIGLEIDGSTVIASEDVIVGKKEVKKLTLANGTTSILSEEVIKELVK